MDDTANLPQLEKRLDWLERERRSDKTALAALQNKIEDLAAENASLRVRLTDLESEISRINTLMARVNQFDVDIGDLRKDLTRQIDDVKNASLEKSLQTEKHNQAIDDLNVDIVDIKKKISSFDQFPQLLEERKVEDIRLARLIEELKAEIIDTNRFDEEYKRSLKILDESLRQETKRITDLQGESAAIRKRLNESREKQDLAGDNVRKLEIRIKELLDAESERKEAQTAFIETVNIAQIERDRTFKAWSERFEAMENITHELEGEISKLEETHGVVNKSIGSLDEVTKRFDRRVNEITEVQRLTEDRFRQEWTTFKSDDQKRWSNYTLAQDEQHREMNRAIDSLTEQIGTLEDLIKRINDTFDQLTRDDIRRMQAQLSAVRESIETYNKILKS
jgi:chromosome segregation ATPase